MGHINDPPPPLWKNNIAIIKYSHSQTETDVTEASYTDATFCGEDILIENGVKIAGKVHRAGVLNIRPEPSPVSHEPLICPITLCEIEKYFCVCDGCHNFFDAKNLMEWVSLKGTCPLCRGKWTSYNMYTHK